MRHRCWRCTQSESVIPDKRRAAETKDRRESETLSGRAAAAAPVEHVCLLIGTHTHRESFSFRSNT